MLARTFTVPYPQTPTYYPRQANRSNPSFIDTTTTITLLYSTITDHPPISFELELTSRIQLTTKNKYSYAKANWQTFREAVKSKIDLSQVNNGLQIKSVTDTAIQKFCSYLKEAESVAVPLQQCKIGTLKLDESIIRLISIRNCIRRKAQRKQSPALKRM